MIDRWITFGVDGVPLAQIESRAWVLRQRERARERKAAHRRTEAGREQRRAEARRRKEKRPDLIAHYKATRHARERGAAGSHTLAEWQAKVATHGGACAYCGRTDVPLTRDHVVPIALGGSHAIENIVPACRPCNSAKGARR